MNLLEKTLIGGGIILSSLLPMKALGQETENKAFYYGGFGFSIKRFNNTMLDEIFGATFGIKGGVGLNTGKTSRIEFEAELSSKKNKDEDMDISSISGGAYYDLVLRPTNKVLFYGGAGIKATSLILQVDFGRNKLEQAKTSGIGYGVRLGIEGQIEDKSTIYFEVTYDEITGTLDEETTNLSGSGLTAGFRYKF